MSPELYIIAGPNGSGKSTFAREFLPKYAKCNHFVNADLIALGLSPFDPARVRLKAGRLMIREIQERISEKQSFAFESTLAGQTYIPLLKNLKKQGWKIHIFFMWISDPRLAKARIRQRVKNGGHDVPDRDIERRLTRSRANFIHHYQDLCDSWILYDNSSSKPVEIAKKNFNGAKIIHKKYFHDFYDGGTDDGRKER